MSTDKDEAAACIEARDNRRWLIGIGISLVFGIFGVVMALMSYSLRSDPGAPAGNARPGTNTPGPGAAPVEPARRGRGDRDRKR